MFPRVPFELTYVNLNLPKYISPELKVLVPCKVDLQARSLLIVKKPHTESRADKLHMYDCHYAICIQVEIYKYLLGRPLEDFREVLHLSSD